MLLLVDCEIVTDVATDRRVKRYRAKGTDCREG